MCVKDIIARKNFKKGWILCAKTENYFLSIQKYYWIVITLFITYFESWLKNDSGYPEYFLEVQVWGPFGKSSKKSSKKPRTINKNNNPPPRFILIKSCVC